MFVCALCYICSFQGVGLKRPEYKVKNKNKFWRSGAHFIVPGMGLIMIFNSSFFKWKFAKKA